MEPHCTCASSTHCELNAVPSKKRRLHSSESLRFFDRTGLGSSFSFSLDMAEVKRVHVEWTVLRMCTTLVNQPFRNLYRQSSDSELHCPTTVDKG